MEKIKLTDTEQLKSLIKKCQLHPIILETGNENVYIPEYHQFIVTKDFLRHTNALFCNCTMLEKIDMKNFDFSEITTMSEWFAKCVSLKEIIFPTKSQLVQIQDLWACFSDTKLEIIDLSFMYFDKEWTVSFDDTFYNSLVKKIILPKCYVDKIDGCFCACWELQEIIAPIRIDFREEDVLLETFCQCEKLKLINLSNGELNIKEFKTQIRNPKNKNALPNDCVIILP